MRKNHLIILGAALLTALVLGGCGNSADEVRYAFVTGPQGTENSSELQAIRSGIERYMSANSIIAKSYMASDSSPSGYAEAFKATNADKARYVIAYGEEMEVPVYAAQNAYHDRKFILFDGEPRKSVDVESKIRKNTECITFDKPTVGFLAGYAPVKMGYKAIAWMTGPSTEKGDLYYEGFLNGIAYAASETGISVDSLKITLVREESDSFSPKRFSDAVQLYRSGCELIVTDSKAISKALIMAADEFGTLVGTVGFDCSSVSDRILFGAMENYEGVMTSLMQSFDGADGFRGGTVLSCTAQQNSAKIVGDYSKMTNYTESDTQKVLVAMAAGSAVVSDTEGKNGEAGKVGLGYTLNVEQFSASQASAEQSTAPEAEASGTEASGTEAETETEGGDE